MNRRYDLFQLYRKAAQLIQNQDPTREIALELIATGEAMLAIVDAPERKAGKVDQGQQEILEVWRESTFQPEGD